MEFELVELVTILNALINSGETNGIAEVEQREIPARKIAAGLDDAVDYELGKRDDEIEKLKTLNYLEKLRDYTRSKRNYENSRANRVF